ncbi:HD-GYP domain-containing protein [Niallia sp. 03133]|uniref:HD-GYP domain-containing protein n=1 Tax=Niallia sp. 03133 TaxID=3458060 RepID=UPI0040448919
MDIINPGEFIETVHIKGVQISLITAGDGTEVIYHKMQPGSRWAMGPVVGWTGLEYIFILSGKLVLHSDVNEKTDTDIQILKQGQAVYGSPVKTHSIFHAEEESEFIYVSSQPVFYQFSQVSKELMELAISIEEKDGYTVDHCERIKNYSMLVGEALDLTSHQLINLNYASFYHDIGKIKVPLHILQKPGKLSAEEWKIMQQHTTYGKEVLSSTNNPALIEIGKIVEQHHERYDGKGYPKGLKEDEISIEASIISVVDSFDAMTTDRVYKKGKSKEEAFKEIKINRGTMYHPLIVDTFLSLKEKILNY